MKKINVISLKVFLGDVDIENVLVSNKISFDEKNYKDFVGYLCDNYKIKPFTYDTSKNESVCKKLMVKLYGCIF